MQIDKRKAQGNVSTVDEECREISAQCRLVDEHRQMSVQCIVRDDHVHARARTYIRTNTRTYAHAQKCMLNAEWSAKSTRDWLTGKKQQQQKHKREMFSECRLVGKNNRRSVCSADLTDKKHDMKAIGECCFLTLMLKVDELTVKYRIRSRPSFVSG